MNEINNKESIEILMDLLNENDIVGLKKILLKKDLDLTFTDQQILYSTLINFKEDFFYTLIQDERFDLTLNNGEIIFNSLFYFSQGHIFYINALLEKNSVIIFLKEAINNEYSFNLLKQQYNEISIIVDLKYKKIIANKIINF